MICNQCGKEIKDGAKFCPFCGSANTPDPSNEPKAQQQSTAEEIKQESLAAQETVKPGEQGKKEERETKPGDASANVPEKKKKKGCGCGCFGIVAILGIGALLLAAAVVVGILCYNGTINIELPFGIGQKQEAVKPVQDPEELEEPEDLIEFETSEPMETAVDTQETEPLETEPEEEELEPLEYFIVNSSTEYFTYDDISSFTADECRKARNGIYARHGRKFKDAALQAYYMEFDWYVPLIEPDYFSEAVLNEIEKANLELIVAFESEKGYN